eukprot:761032-Hanusia_phi.AAC.4
MPPPLYLPTPPTTSPYVTRSMLLEPPQGRAREPVSNCQSNSPPVSNMIEQMDTPPANNNEG